MESTKETSAPVAIDTPKKDEKKNRTILMFLIFSGILNGVLFFLYLYERENYKTVVVEKQTIVEKGNDVKAELVQLQEEYLSLETSDKVLRIELDDKKEKIAKLILEAEKHKGDAYYISKLKKETETLRTIMKGYIHTIDSLNTLNKTLFSENIKVNSKLLTEKEKNEQISREKEELSTVIKQGSVLTATGIVAAGVHYRSGGKKEIETTKARKTEKIKVSFTIGENRIAQKGKRELFLRILTPDGKELARSLDDANSFSFNGVRGFFCDRKGIDYQNAATSVSMFAELKAGFVAGKYMIQVYTEGSEIGETTLVLE